MKIIAIGDSHFDSRPGGRLDECVRVHDWIAAETSRLGASAFLHAGDLFEHAKGTSPVERAAAADFLVRTSGGDVNVIGVRGNHDPAGDCEFMERIAAAGAISWAEVPTVELLQYDSGGPPVAAPVDVAVVCLPWPSKSGLLAWLSDRGLSTAPDDVDDAMRSDLRVIVRALVDEAQLHARAGVPQRIILLAHAMVDGSETSTGQPLVGVPMRVALSDLRVPGVDLVVLGHVHRSQAWLSPTDTLCDVVYTGSPRRTTFGELEEKSMLVIDVQPTGPIGWERVPIPCRAMIRLEADWESGAEGDFLDWTYREEPAGALQGAEVALHVWASAADRADARRAADQAGALFERAHGAESVKVTIHTVPTQVVRSPEVCAADGVAAKFEAHWSAQASTAERDAAAVVVLAELVAEAGETSPRVNAERGLALERLQVESMGALGTVDIDLRGLSGVVALTGRNGSGKTTGAELLGFSGMYRRTLTIDALRDLACSRGSFVEVQARGSRGLYVFRHTVDSQTKRSESLVTLDGVPLLEDTKVTTFDRWADENLPHPSVTLATTFAQQGSRRLVEQAPADRRRVVLRALGLEQLEAVVDLARRRADAAESEAQELCVKIDGRLEGVPDIEDLESERGDQQVAQENRRQSAAFARGVLDTAADQQTTADSEYAEAQGAYAAQQQARKDAIVRVEDARTALAKANEIAKKAGDAGARLAELSEAVALVDTRRRELAELETELESADGLVASSREKADATRPEVDRLRSIVGQLRGGLDAARDLSGATPDEIGKAGQVDEAASTLAEGRALVRELEAQLAEARGTRDGVSTRRIDGLRRGLEDVRDAPGAASKAECSERAGETLTQDDETLAASRKAADLVHALASDVGEARTGVARFEPIDREAARCRALVDAQAVHRERRAAMEEDLAQRETEFRAAAQPHAIAGDATRGAERVAAAKRVQVDAARAEIDRLHAAEREAQELRASSGDPDAATQAAKAAADRLCQQNADLARLDEAQVAAPVARDCGVAEARDAERTAREALESATAELRAVEARIAQAEEAATAVAEWKKEVADLNAQRRTLRRLQRDGETIRLLEIDGAGPRVAALANELLADVADGRWSIELRTQKPYAGTARVDEAQDCYEILVHDAGDEEHQPRTADVTKYSGGELTVISEALSLALTMVACDRAAVGEAGATIIRDESGAALDDVNGAEYVAMLRRAIDMIGTPLAIIVSHDPGVVAACDSRIVAAGNTWEVIR